MLRFDPQKSETVLQCVRAFPTRRKSIHETVRVQRAPLPTPRVPTIPFAHSRVGRSLRPAITLTASARWSPEY